MMIFYYLGTYYHNTSKFYNMTHYYHSIGDTYKEQIYSFFKTLDQYVYYILFVFFFNLSLIIVFFSHIGKGLNRKLVLVVTYLLYLLLFFFMLILAHDILIGITGLVVCLVLGIFIFKKRYKRLYPFIVPLTFILICMIAVFYYKSLQLPKELNLTQDYDTFCIKDENQIQCAYYKLEYPNYTTTDFQMTFLNHQILDNIKTGEYTIVIYDNRYRTYELENNDFNIGGNNLSLDLLEIKKQANFRLSDYSEDSLFFKIGIVDHNGHEVNLSWSNQYAFKLKQLNE